MITENKVPEIVKQLAWHIFNNDKKPTVLDDATMHNEIEPQIKSGLLTETDEGITFSDKKDIVSFAAQYFVNTNLSELLGSPEACFDQLYDIYRNEVRQELSVSGQSLALLHNAGHFNAFDWALKAVESGTRAFNVFHVFEGAIAYIEEAPAESIMAFTSGYYKKVKHDYLPGNIFPEMDKWFATHLDVAATIIQSHQQSPDESTANIFSSALRGQIKHDFQTGCEAVLRFSQYDICSIAGPAIHTLSLIEYELPSQSDELKKAISQCRQKIESPSHPLLHTAVSALTRLVQYDEGISELLIKAGKTKAPEALQPISYLLFQKQKTYEGRTWFHDLFELLTETKASDTDTLQNIDFIFSEWIKKDQYRDKVINFIEAWMVKQDTATIHAGVIETHFNSLVDDIANDATLLSQLITKWLLTDDRRFPLAISKYLSHLRIAGLSTILLNKDILDDLRENDLRFLVRRILGYLSGDEMLISLLFSMQNTKDAKTRTHGLINGVLLDHIGRDYPHDTVEYLKARENDPILDEETKQLCADICRRIEQYMKTLRELQDCKELHPSHAKARQIRKAFAKQMGEAFDEASKNSIWRQLTTQIHLKAGKRSFQKIGGQYTEPMELKPMSQEFTLPRSEIIDPAGAARERFLFRQVTRDDP